MLLSSHLKKLSLPPVSLLISGENDLPSLLGIRSFLRPFLLMLLPHTSRSLLRGNSEDCTPSLSPATPHLVLTTSHLRSLGLCRMLKCVCFPQSCRVGQLSACAHKLRERLMLAATGSWPSRGGRVGDFAEHGVGLQASFEGSLVGFPVTHG